MSLKIRQHLNSLWKVAIPLPLGDLSVASQSPFSLTFSALVTSLWPRGGLWSELITTEVGEEGTILVTLYQGPIKTFRKVRDTEKWMLPSLPNVKSKFCHTHTHTHGPKINGKKAKILIYPKKSTLISLTSKLKWKSLSHVQLFATPWTIQSLEFSRPEYWSG